MMSSPVAAVDQELLSALRADGVRRRGQAAHGVRGARRRGADVVVALRSADDHRVDPLVGVRGEDVARARRGAGEIQHGHAIRAALRPDVDRLDAGQVGLAAGAVAHTRAREQPPDVDRVVGRAAGGGRPVLAGAALDAVTPVRRAAMEGVVAVAEIHDVIAAPAGDPVVVRAPAHLVRGVRAAEAVVAGAAVQGEGDALADAGVRLDEVDLAVPQDGQAVVAGPGAVDPDRRQGEVADREVVAGRLDLEEVERIGPVDGDPVGGAVERAEVGVDARDLGRPEVADVDQVGATRGADVERLDAAGLGGRRPVSRETGAGCRRPAA